jgi:hypothetical protein
VRTRRRRYALSGIGSFAVLVERDAVRDATSTPCRYQYSR